jgi:hypothetical protein
MPAKDGTGPPGQGLGGGRGLGRGSGRGLAQGRGRRRQPGGYGLGPAGSCVCTNPKCKHKISHRRGVPCYNEVCPKCGSPMTREF